MRASKRNPLALFSLIAGWAFWQPSFATDPARVDGIQVTATRVPSPIDLIPADISIVSGEDLRARGVRDLAGAMNLVAGVEAPAGGDSGPASAVTSFWGLHEFDAFLLVVDGVPWGGAFNPAISSVSFNNVERIEVLKGSAPVIYGATSFVGVIHVIHYAAGKASQEGQIGFGSHNSLRLSAATALSGSEAYRQSLSFEAEKNGFADGREKVNGANLSYRGALALAGGSLRIDAGLSQRRTVPPSPVVRTETGLSSVVPLDVNLNPPDARIDEDRYQFGLGYSRESAGGQWEGQLAWTGTGINDVRGFLRSDLTDDGSDNADFQRQRRTIHDFYADLHWSRTVARDVSLLAGADLLYGTGKQASSNGAYYVLWNGSRLPPRTTEQHTDEINTIVDTRTFAGQYAQLAWQPDTRWGLVAGVRINETREKKTSVHRDGFDSAGNEAAADKQSNVRAGGTFGVRYRAWQNGADETVLYADYRNTFKPSAIDFGPDYSPDILKPETAQSAEAGIKGALLEGRLTYHANAFWLQFRNLVLHTTDAEGAPILVNAGGERLRGVEADTRFRWASDLSVAANASYHDARFTTGVASEGGEDVALAGKRLTLSPRRLVATGLLYVPKRGLNATATANFVGRRYLDLANRAMTGGYTRIDGSIGYRFATASLTLNLYNLSGKRPPVTQSEFGDASYYLLAGRQLFLNLGFAL